MDDRYDFLIKIVLAGNIMNIKIKHIIGSSAVGKSNILTRFTRNKFNLESKPTIGVEFASRDVVVDNKVIRVQIWDTAGQERYKSMSQGFYRNAIGAFLVYEISRQETFEELPKWLHECRVNSSPYLKLCLLGNKSDLTNIREVTKLQAKNFANENGLLFCECSALTGEGIEKALQLLISDIYEQMQRDDLIVDNPLHQKKDSISIKNQQKKSSSMCCYQ